MVITLTNFSTAVLMDTAKDQSLVNEYIIETFVNIYDTVYIQLLHLS